MAARARSARKAAQTVSYAYTGPAFSDDEAGGGGASDEDDDDFGRATKAPSGAAKPRKKPKVDLASSEVDPDDDMSAAQVTVPPTPSRDGFEEIEYEVKRVDFSKLLPIETLTKVFSHLHPASLYHLLDLSRTFRTILKSKTLAPVWREAMRPRKGFVVPFSKEKLQANRALPKVDGEEVHPIQLAAVLFDETCEYCGERKVDRCDRYLLIRLCDDCRTRNLISVTDVSKDKAYQDLHPATMQCIISTPLPPHCLRWARSQRSWVLPSDLRDVSEVLEELQLEDDAVASGYGEDLVDAKTVQKGLSRAKRLKSRWYGDGKTRAYEIEEDLVKKYTPRVREYVLERKQLQKDRLAARFAPSLSSPEQRSGESHDQALCYSRGKAVEQRVVKSGIFKLSNTQMNNLKTHPLVSKPEPLTDDIWDAIAPAVYRFIARDIAGNIFAKCGKKKAQDVDSDDEADLLKKPKTVTKEGWKYVRPELVKVAKEWRKERKEQVKKLAAGQQKREAQGPQLTPAQIASKNEFFRGRYQKAVESCADEATRNSMPRFGEFLLLPTVAELYADPKFAVSTEKADCEADDQLWGVACLGDVVADMASFAVDTRCEALRLVLAATNEIFDALDDFDLVEALQDDDEYGDAFFARASSYVSCGLCGTMFGPLDDVLAHVHKFHPFTSAYSAKTQKLATSLDDFAAKVDLSLEVACAWSAILELAGIDNADGVVTDGELDTAFKDKKLVWENAPRGTKKRATWSELIPRVTLAARAAHRTGDVLDVPVIALKNLNRRERYYRA
ncbi:hypothetical protein JCM3770_004030 [Rhodotorula araucariae]